MDFGLERKLDAADHRHACTAECRLLIKCVAFRRRLASTSTASRLHTAQLSLSRLDSAYRASGKREAVSRALTVTEQQPFLSFQPTFACLLACSQSDLRAVRFWRKFCSLHAMERSKGSLEAVSRIPVLRTPSEPAAEKGLDAKVKQIEEYLQKPDRAVDSVTKLLLGFCRDSASAIKQLQGQVESLKADNTTARQKIKRLQQEIEEVREKTTTAKNDCGGLRTTVEYVKDNFAKSLQVLKSDVKTATSRMSEFESDVRARLRELPDVQRVSTTVQEVVTTATNALEERLGKDIATRASTTDIQHVADDTHALGERMKVLEDKITVQDMKRTLLDHFEQGDTSSPQKYLEELHVMRGPRDPPFKWSLSEYQKVKELSKLDEGFRLFSRPFGIEKEGSVRCVLRLYAALGVAAHDGEESVQLGVEVLHVTKCSKKFDFYFRLVDGTGKGRHLVKTFSSNEIFVPRYWLPQSAGASRLVSFAVLVSDDRMEKDGLLFKDCVYLEVGLQ